MHVPKVLKFIHRVFVNDPPFNQAIRSIIQLPIKNPALYREAFLHRSLQDPQGSNERLEFLGDAVLHSIITEYLYGVFPDESEQFLTDTRAKLVGRTALQQLAQQVGLTPLLQHSPALKPQQSKYLLGNALEALVGAVHLDHGYNACKHTVIKHWFSQHIDIYHIIDDQINHKGILLEWAQKQRKCVEFSLTTETNLPPYRVVCQVDGKAVAYGSASTKKIAEQCAAEDACQRLDVPTSYFAAREMSKAETTVLEA